MDIIQHRRALHRIPELCLELPETMDYLRRALSGLGCTLLEPVSSSLAAYFDFGADRTLAFRADADALPITERRDTPYRSRYPGRMHACGHDGHMAILLELARRISEKKRLPHNILLIFQPGEESPGGAERICETGLLERFRVKAVFGLHLWPGLPAGKVFSREGELMARTSEVTVDITGLSSHIAKAEAGKDAMACGMEFCRRAGEMEARLPEGVYRLLKFGIFRSGTARNAISAHTHLEGSLRAFQEDVFLDLRQGLENMAGDLEKETGCGIRLHFSDGYPAVLNPASLCRCVMETAPYEILDVPSMTAEDFSWYQRRAPGMFFFLGLGDVPPLHADTFDFDESLLEIGADYFMKLAEEFP